MAKYLDDDKVVSVIDIAAGWTDTDLSNIAAIAWHSLEELVRAILEKIPKKDKKAFVNRIDPHLISLVKEERFVRFCDFVNEKMVSGGAFTKSRVISTVDMMHPKVVVFIMKDGTSHMVARQDIETAEKDGFLTDTDMTFGNNKIVFADIEKFETK